MKTSVLKSVCLLFVLYFSTFLQLSAQKLAVGSATGIVNSNTKNPLQGVMVVARQKEKNVAQTLTDSVGKFSFTSLRAGAYDFIFSSVGYKSQTLTGYIVREGETTSMLVEMVSEANVLNEVVVVGYGTQKKVNLTGAVATVTTGNIVNRPVTSLTNSLQGAVPGMTIIARPGDVGSDIGTINIRGRGNLGTSAPLYVVDGVPVDADAFARINPSDVESMSILKDASSAAIYGSRAAYGVILVTTKRGGTADKMTVNYNAYYGVQSPTVLPHFVGSYDYATLLNEAYTNAGGQPIYTAANLQSIQGHKSLDSFPDNNWYKLALRKNAPVWQNELNISGGGKTRYYISGAMMKQSSLIPNEGLTRYSLRSNTESQVNKIFKVGTNLSFIRDEINDKSGAVDFTTINRMLPLTVNKQSDGSWGTVSGGAINSVQGNGNPVRKEQQGGHSAQAANRFLGTVTGSLTPIAGLKIDGSLSYSATNRTASFFNNNMDLLTNFFTKKPMPGTGQASSLSDTTQNKSVFLSQIYASYEKTFKNHYAKIMIGSSYENDKDSWLSAYRDSFPTNGLSEISAGAQNADVNNGGISEQRILISYFGRLNYAFMNKYLLEFNFRTDASSQFAPGHRWGYFPSVSAGWKISDEGFMKNIKWVDLLKLRGSWGKLGNISNVGYYDYLDLLNVGTTAILGSSPVTGVYPSSAPNPNLTWEVVNMSNIGLDAELFHRKLSVQIDAYNKVTQNILLQLPQPLEYGYYTNPSQNAAKVSNKGIELTLTHNGSIGKLQYSISGNMSKVWNKILDMHGQDNTVTGTYYVDKQGQAIGSFYMYRAEGLFKDAASVAASAQANTAKPGDIKYADLNGDGAINSADRTVVGNDVPYFNYGLNLNLNYKGFDFMLLGQGVSNVKVYLENEASQAFFNGAGAKEYVLGRWTTANPNPNAVYPRILISQNNANNLAYSSFWLFNASYFRVKTLSLGYTFPSSIISNKVIKAFRLYASSNNPFTIRGDKRMKDFDPEAPSSRSSYPQLKTWSFGANITF